MRAEVSRLVDELRLALAAAPESSWTAFWARLWREHGQAELEELRREAWSQLEWRDEVVRKILAVCLKDEDCPPGPEEFGVSAQGGGRR